MYRVSIVWRGSLLREARTSWQRPSQSRQHCPFKKSSLLVIVGPSDRAANAGVSFDLSKQWIATEAEGMHSLLSQFPLLASIFLLSIQLGPRAAVNLGLLHHQIYPTFNRMRIPTVPRSIQTFAKCKWASYPTVLLPGSLPGTQVVVAILVFRGTMARRKSNRPTGKSPPAKSTNKSRVSSIQQREGMPAPETPRPASSLAHTEANHARLNPQQLIAASDARPRRLSKKKIGIVRRRATQLHWRAFEKSVRERRMPGRVLVQGPAELGMALGRPATADVDLEDEESSADQSITDFRNECIKIAKQNMREAPLHLTTLTAEEFAFTTGLCKPRVTRRLLETVRCLTTCVVDYAKFIILAKDSEQLSIREAQKRGYVPPGPSPLRLVQTAAASEPRQLAGQKRKAEDMDEEPPSKKRSLSSDPQPPVPPQAAQPSSSQPAPKFEQWTDIPERKLVSLYEAFLKSQGL